VSHKNSNIRRVKTTSKRNTGGGIKALITVGDLQAIISAARKWQEKCVDEGRDASKLLHHIANAEAVLVKFRNRNRLAFERREAYRRNKFEEESALEPITPISWSPPPIETEPTPSFSEKAWSALDILGLRKKQTPTSPKAERKRDTRW
jgi:hypothetical protein